MIKPEIIERLIAMGNVDDLDSISITERFSDLAEHDEINRLHWKDWNNATTNLKTEDLVALLKALTICELRFKWIGGSVSAVIWVYKELERRDLDLSKELYDWIVERTENPYAPTGSMR